MSVNGVIGLLRLRVRHLQTRCKCCPCWYTYGPRSPIPDTSLQWHSNIYLMLSHVSEPFILMLPTERGWSLLHRRCPVAQDMGIARLDVWRFLINQEGYATIIPDQSAHVFGVLWSVTSACEAALDDYEEIATGLYTKAYIEIQDTPALVYLATNTHPGYPRAGYLEAIIAEAYRRSFDLDYITKDLKRWM
jgi:AIG2-like family